MQLNVRQGQAVYFSPTKPKEVVVPELSESDATFAEQAVGDAATPMTRSGQRVLDFIVGTQRTMFEEMMVSGGEAADRMRTEMQLLSELASKLAETHSVNNIQAMWQECSRHQIDFLRREAERLFRHGERWIESTAKLAGNALN
jgi:hypothetical protein